LIARSLKVQNILLNSPGPLVARLYSLGLRQPKTRMFEVVEQPAPSSQFHNERAHPKSSRQCCVNKRDETQEPCRSRWALSATATAAEPRLELGLCNCLKPLLIWQKLPQHSGRTS
jgi:hypothetical protein